MLWMALLPIRVQSYNILATYWYVYVGWWPLVHVIARFRALSAL